MSAFKHTADQQPKGHLHACGFNAFGQLTPGSHEDLRAFRRLPPESAPVTPETKLLFLGWSETSLFSPSTDPSESLLVRYGSTAKDCVSPVSDPVLGVGDHNGLSVILDTEGRVGFLDRPADDACAPLSSPRSGDEGRRIVHLAAAGNGHVAAVPVHSDDSPESHVLAFASLDRFREWCTRPDGDHATTRRFTLPGRITQLVANATAFACLLHDGTVYTWGDARHGSLGRSTQGQEPGLVESLAGLKITALASGGWATAALSEDGAAYLFGATTPGTDTSIGCLHALDPDRAALVDVIDDGEPLDVLDIAVGDGHVVVLVEGGRVFVAGDNRNGQLGLGDGGADFVEEWTETEVPDGRRCAAVHAGPKCTFVRVES